MRLFIAMGIPEELRVKVGSLAQEIRQICPGLQATWTLPENYHLTLAFLGPSDEKDLPIIAQASRERARATQQAQVSLGGLGAFPSPQRPRALWIGLIKGAEVVRQLARQLAWQLKSNNIAFDDKEFAGHLTIARLRGNPPSPKILSQIKGMIERPDPALGEWTIENIALMESHIKNGETPQYVVLESFPIGKKAPLS